MTMTATMSSVRSLRGPERDHWRWTNTLISRTLCIIHAGATPSSAPILHREDSVVGSGLERARHIQIILDGIPRACAGSSSSSSSGRRVFRQPLTQPSPADSMYCASGWILKGLNDWQLALVYQRAIHPSLHRRCHAGMTGRHPSRSWPKT
ncbi:hypothetical protein DFH07DRAFT_226359 [Mycena maculata]|uniref:Uncharacterized protein n=1 Tax=Mycena maculata TaxID=230809 RepID=A0AAD7JT89_9AGAR|nr:hypothetical protein DFH07DRAFT_226359 [Mycena maculata]